MKHLHAYVIWTSYTNKYIQDNVKIFNSFFFNLWQVTKATMVCSKHFEPNDYKRSLTGMRLLKPDAVPSIFQWSTTSTPRSGLATKRKFQEHVTEMETEDHDTTECTPTVLDFVKTPEKTVEQLQEELDRAKNLMEKKDTEISTLKQQLSLCRFGIERFGSDDTLIAYYTGFTSNAALRAFFNYISQAASTMASAYYMPSESVSAAGRPRSLLLIDELFFLCKLRMNLGVQDLAVRFLISQSSVSRKIITWANFLYFVLGQLPIWLSRKHVDTLMPAMFKVKYPNTRIIIDCTEIGTQMPSSLLANSQLYSSYKSRTTYKSLVGIAPHGAVTFVSPLYSGNMSDPEITRLSGLLDLLEPGDSVMADKGFLVEKMLNEKDISLNIPAFLSNKGQFSPQEINKNEEIASLRIHVERYIRRVKENHLFDCALPLTLAGSANQIWTVACILANFRGPLIK